MGRAARPRRCPGAANDEWCDGTASSTCWPARNTVLEKAAESFMQAAEAQFATTQQKVRNFHEIEYAAQTWDRPRRVIVKAERLVQGPTFDSW
ncbi:MAG: transposase [Planctomycetia bacterium]|nr:transposase [Planctomycetia bacterium]